jgi:hypothetical protein
MNAVIYMESVITRHVVMQSVHADRRFVTAARFGTMTEADVGLTKPVRYAATAIGSAMFDDRFSSVHE